MKEINISSILGFLIADCRLKIKKTISLLVIMLSGIWFVSASYAEPVHPWDLVPTDNEVTGWVVDSAAGGIGQATSATLFNYINGGAGFYLEKEFIEGAVCYNKDGQDNKLQLYFYEFVNAESALALYNADQPASPEAVDTLGDKAVWSATLFYGNFKMVRDQYFLDINLLPTGDPGKVLAASIANVILGKISQTGMFPQRTESDRRQGIRIFPNPANGSVAVADPRPANNSYSVQVCNASGTVLDEYYKPVFPLSIHTGAYQEGTYFVRLVAGNKMTVQKLDIIK